MTNLFLITEYTTSIIFSTDVIYLCVIYSGLFGT